MRSKPNAGAWLVGEVGALRPALERVVEKKEAIPGPSCALCEGASRRSRTSRGLLARLSSHVVQALEVERSLRLDEGMARGSGERNLLAAEGTTGFRGTG